MNTQPTDSFEFETIHIPDLPVTFHAFEYDKVNVIKIEILI